MTEPINIEAAVQAVWRSIRLYRDVIKRPIYDGQTAGSRAAQQQIEQTIRHACAVARRDALREVQCCQEYHDFAECPIAVALAEAEEAVQRGNR